MRIDGAVPVPENQQTQKAANSGSSAPQRRSASITAGQDQAQLSVDSGKVQVLQAKLSQLPDIRQDRVDALRQSINSGSYQVSDKQLANAIGSDLLGRVIG